VHCAGVCRGKAVEGVEMVPEDALHLARQPPGLVALLAAAVRQPDPRVTATCRQRVRVSGVPGQALHLLLVIPAHIYKKDVTRASDPDPNGSAFARVDFIGIPCPNI